MCLPLLQAAEHLDDEDVEDEETALENFTTAVDNDETDEYIAFRSSLQGKTMTVDHPVYSLQSSPVPVHHAFSDICLC